MEPKDPDRPSDLAGEMQKNLLAFLRADLDLGFEMLAKAKAASPSYREQTLATIGRAIRIIRGYLAEVKDATAFDEIVERVDELEAAAGKMGQPGTPDR